jgi:hypothetical protein
VARTLLDYLPLDGAGCGQSGLIVFFGVGAGITGLGTFCKLSGFFTGRLLPILLHTPFLRSRARCAASGTSSVYDDLKGALIPIVALTRGFPLAPFGCPEPGTVPNDG